MASQEPDHDQLAKILTAQWQALRNAGRRRGERPMDFPSRNRTIDEFTMASLSNQTNTYTMMITVIGEPYHPSIAPLDSLEKISIKDLKLETNHRGSYLLLRCLCSPMRQTAITNVVEDEQGMAITITVYLQEPEQIRPATSSLKQNRVLIVKEPYFKVAISGRYAIRVDHPTDIVWLSEDDPRIPKEWRSKSSSETQSAEYWKKKGNDLVNSGNLHDAIEMYSRGLRSSPTSVEKEILRNNRALAFLRVEAYDAVLEDVAFLPDLEQRSEKALYRGALALYEAEEVLRVLLRRFPQSAAAKHELQRTKFRIEEQKKGVYDWKTIYKASELRPPKIDCASFLGPVEPRQSAGRGRGLFTTKPVKSGDLLLCEKGFSYCFAAPPGEMLNAKSISPASILLDVPGNRISVGTHADIIRDVSNKLVAVPSLKPEFEALHHGTYEPGTSDTVDGAPVVDTFLVANIIHSNCFSCPPTSKDAISDVDWNRGTKVPSKIPHGAFSTNSTYRTTGIWLKASLVNHSCDANCRRSFLGDLQIIRAARDLPAGTELGFSYMTLQDPKSLNEQLLKGWGFECCCSICVEDRELSPGIKNQRTKLLEEFNNIPNSNLEKKKEVVQQLESTYSQPSTEVPRPQMLRPLFSLVPLYATGKHGNVEKLVDQVLATFSSAGYIIKGAGLLDVEEVPPRIKVEKWGLPADEATSAWLTLRNAYKTIGDMARAEQAKDLARISWMLLVGEDYSFVWENPPEM